MVHTRRKPRARRKPSPPKAAKARAVKARKERGKGHQKKRAYSAREEEDGSDDRPQFDSEDEKWYAEEEKGAEDQWWSEEYDGQRHRAKKVKETSALDELFY